MEILSDWIRWGDVPPGKDEHHATLVRWGRRMPSHAIRFGDRGLWLGEHYKGGIQPGSGWPWSGGIMDGETAIVIERDVPIVIGHDGVRCEAAKLIPRTQVAARV